MKFKKTLKKSAIIREITRAYRNFYKPNWDRITNKEYLSEIEILTKEKRVLIVTGGGGYAAAKQIESILAAALKLRGVGVDVLLCDGVLPGCFQTTVAWDQNETVFAKKAQVR